MTESMIGTFQRAGETTWQDRHGYDFAKIRIPGLTNPSQNRH
nr:OprD family outer membrane porin [Pseudomonas migulae]